MADKSSSSSGGMGCLGTLTLIFIVLKLVGVITWSWFWVLSPAIFSFALLVLILLVAGLIILFFGRTSARKFKPKKVKKVLPPRRDTVLESFPLNRPVTDYEPLGWKTDDDTFKE